jgi:hypothetical protein
MIATIERVISNALAATVERLPEPPDDGLDPVNKSAWNYVAQEQSQALPPAAAAGSAYAKLQRAFDARSNVHQTIEVLEWLQNTHALPDADPAAPDDAAAAVRIFEYRSMTQPGVKEWLEEIRADPCTLDGDARRNFALMERLWLESAGLDETLVNNLSRACSASGRAWEKARPQSDFAAWLPHLEEVVNLARQKGEAVGQGIRGFAIPGVARNFQSWATRRGCERGLWRTARKTARFGQEGHGKTSCRGTADSTAPRPGGRSAPGGAAADASPGA